MWIHKACDGSFYWCTASRFSVNGEAKIPPGDSHGIGIEECNGFIIREAANGVSDVFSNS
jgi:hypothetical protein